MRLLVVGASGFIGGHLLNGARGAGWTVFGTAHDHPGERLARFDLAQDRIEEGAPPDFLSDGSPRCAVICAGVTDIDRCRREREATRRVNVDGTLRLVHDLNARGVPCVCLSSDAVFDGRRGGYTEADTPAPVTEYGRQKLAAEEGVLAAAPSNLVLRLGKIVGDVPGESHLFTDWLELQQAGRAIRCIRGQVLSPTWVEDVVAGVMAAVRLRLSGLFHLCAPEAWLRADLVRRFLEVVGGTVDIVEEDAAAFGFVEERPLRSWLDGTRFATRTGQRFATMGDVLSSFSSRLVAVRGAR